MANDNIVTKSIRMMAPGTKDRLIWEVFGGNLWIKVIKDNDYRNATRKRVVDEVRTVVRITLAKIQKENGGVKHPLLVSVWDNKNRQQKRDYVLTIGKDEQRVYYFELDMGSGSQQFKFPPGLNVTVGSDKMSDDQISAIHLETFLEYLDKIVPVEMVKTAPTIQQMKEFRERGNNNSSGSNDSKDELSF